MDSKNLSCPLVAAGVITGDHVMHRPKRKLVIPRFRNLIIALVFISSALISTYILRYDYVLQLTPNGHWYALVGFAAVDLIIALQLVLTGLLRVWDRIVLRIAGVWAIISLLAVVADVFFGLQLPQGYPNITPVQAFQYLFLGINGNAVPSGTSALFTLYVIATVLCLLPSNRFWFNWATLPTWRTVLAVIVIGLIVMGLRPIILPMFLSQISQSHGTEGSMTQVVFPPTVHSAIPHDASNRTIFLSLVAETQSSIPYNFNSTQYGHMIVYIPADWTIDLTFTNEEGITHNAVLIKPDVPIPTYNLANDGTVIAQIPQNAIEGNFLVSGQSGSVLTNLSPGTYWIACAMSFPTPHAESGMWIILQVSTTVTTPYFTVLT